jgi:hypothetical protein
MEGAAVYKFFLLLPLTFIPAIFDSIGKIILRA